MLTLLLTAGLSAQAADADLADAFTRSAEAHAVPEKLLLALAWEASHWNPAVTSAWGGYGLFDMREPGETLGGVDVEAAAALIDENPDAVIADPTLQIEAAAALLAHEAALSNGGVAPDPTDLVAWWDAVRAFSGRDEPDLQAMYASFIFESVNFGVDPDPSTGLRIRPQPVNHWDLEPKMAPTSCDYSGCYQFTAASTANYSDYSRTGSDINYVVIHTVQGSYAGCISWFQNSSASVSAHYVVRSSDGQVTQMVKEEDVAWHAGNWTYNTESVGIEHEGYIDQPETYYTDAMYQGSAKLTSDIISRTNATASRSSIIGHVEVPGATHTDPGDYWDWDLYMSYITGGESTGDLIGVVADSDIYNGTRLVGADAWVEETGEHSSADGDGYYRFYDLPLGSYTIHAIADGYAEGTCTKEISTGQNWCSIALFPGGSDDGGGDDGGGTGTDTGPVVTDTGGSDDGGGDPTEGNPPGARPGRRTLLANEPTGCGCATSANPIGPLALGLLGLLTLGWRRRR